MRQPQDSIAGSDSSEAASAATPAAAPLPRFPAEGMNEM